MPRRMCPKDYNTIPEGKFRNPKCPDNEQHVMDTELDAYRREKAKNIETEQVNIARKQEDIESWKNAQKLPDKI